MRAVAIHGDRSQVAARASAWRTSSTVGSQVLVATDVAARGIHVDDVALVMHYDPAATDKDYVHRSGRTGRAGQPGRVISMVVEDKKKEARQLQKQLGHRLGFDQLDLADFVPMQRRPSAESDRPSDRPGRTETPSPRRSTSSESDRGEPNGGRDERRRSWGARPRTAPSSRRRSSKDWYPPSTEGKSSGARRATGPSAKAAKPVGKGKPVGKAGSPTPKPARSKPKRATSTKDVGKRRSPRGQ